MSLSSMLGPCVLSSLAEMIPDAAHQLCRLLNTSFSYSRFLPLDDADEDCSAALAFAACSRTAAMNARILVCTDGRSNVICLLVS
jgi:hypothetical protein